jgi:hypothetical protein
MEACYDNPCIILREIAHLPRVRGKGLLVYPYVATNCPDCCCSANAPLGTLWACPCTERDFYWLGWQAEQTWHSPNFGPSQEQIKAALIWEAECN